MKKVLITLILLLSCLAIQYVTASPPDTSVIVIAKTTTDSVAAPAPAPTVLYEKPTYLIIGLAILGILELIFRLVPSTRNLSILSWLYRILNTIIPNKNETGANHDPTITS